MSLITKPNTFSAGLPIIASEHNENFDTIYDDHNGGLTNANIDSNAAIVDTKLAQITTAAKVSSTAFTVSSQAQGDVLYYNGSAWTRLAAGTSGKYLKTQGSSANPTWATLADGMTATLISTYTATGSSTYDDVNASSVVGTNFALIFIEIKNNHGSTPCNLLIRPNGSSATLEPASTNVHPATAALAAGKSTFLCVATDASGIFEIASTQAISLTVNCHFFITGGT